MLFLMGVEIKTFSPACLPPAPYTEKAKLQVNFFRKQGI
ncbi:hypothetical protein Cst_c24370 [Thermoclostridium stercorarium subsp. stercorarium DSM 8532]|uniref:Uncharacterized protein n=1 Tax=Thermoclostridium stercorarium (strain ATCC 35414 / DSM 8532 / NCIMB 11754) TaxID=1121335 RepID=L7VRI3_THES1|nr:hypothetical protein Cst_c24370 [Thermoclostridium stercorarium subsp. stercorarium DSM 8532]